jgi:hypothetical protein
LTAFLCFGVFALVAAAAVKLAPRSSGGAVTVEKFDFLALSARYRPMLRLLDGSDFELLNDAGDPKLMRRMRAQRRAIFRGYLKSLRRDHAMLCDCVRALIVHADSDQAALVSNLYRMENSFRFLVLGVNFRLALHALGANNVAVWSLMDCFEKLRSQAELLSSSSPVAAHLLA